MIAFYFCSRFITYVDRGHGACIPLENKGTNFLSPFKFFVPSSLWTLPDGFGCLPPSLTLGDKGTIPKIPTPIEIFQNWFHIYGVNFLDLVPVVPSSFSRGIHSFSSLQFTFSFLSRFVTLSPTTNFSFLSILLNYSRCFRITTTTVHKSGNTTNIQTTCTMCFGTRLPQLFYYPSFLC